MTGKPLTTAGSAGRSYFGAGSRIFGETSFSGTVELPGYVKGRVETAAIVIEETGEVEGELHASSIAIKECFTVKLLANARPVRDISYEILSIDSGAELEEICAAPYLHRAVHAQLIHQTKLPHAGLSDRADRCDCCRWPGRAQRESTLKSVGRGPWRRVARPPRNGPQAPRLRSPLRRNHGIN